MSLNGCRWQEKSFSVTMKQDKPLDICKCGTEIKGVKYLYNGETLCQNCFSNKKSLRQRLGISDFNFNTTKDRLYNFLDTNTFKKPVQVTGKGHWKRLLKENGLTDDFEQRPKKANELKKPFDDYKPVGKEFIRNEIARELQEKGLRHKLIRRE